jgi:hypothetical protein
MRSIDTVKVRRLVVIKIHPNDDTEETAYLWHTNSNFVILADSGLRAPRGDVPQEYRRKIFGETAREIFGCKG